MDWLLLETASKTLASPIATFVLLLAIALLTPPLFERLKLPGLVGLLAAGVIFGSSALGWLDASSETMKLLSEIGKTYLMFVAGLEIDLALFNKTRNRSLSFGIFTFIVPFASGMAVGLVFGFGWLAAVLIGSLLASHTLLAYPIVQRLGVVSDEAVTVTVGATIFTDIAALLVLAICLGVNQGDFTTEKLLFLLGSLGVYSIAVLIGLKRLAIAFFRANGKDESSQFLFVMLSVFLAAVTAQLIGVEGIIGAFLAGLAINSVIGQSPVKEKIEFIGSALFIPMFFINMGLLLNLSALGELLQFIALPIAIVGALLGSKLIATLLTKQLFKYDWPQTWTMWSLSIPQVAATLAAALVGYEASIINEQVFNSVILLMLVTSILGPLVTANAARKMALANTQKNAAPLTWLPVPVEGTTATEQAAQPSNPFTTIVPIYNPKTEMRLLELAAIIAQYEKGRIVPLSVVAAQPQMDSPRIARALLRSQKRLQLAATIREQYAIAVEPIARIEHNVARAIAHVSREQNATLIVLGIGQPARFNAPILNSVHDAVLWSTHCPVVVARLLTSPSEFKNILLPVDTLSPASARVLRFAQVLAASNGGKVTLLHVCNKSSSQSYRQALKHQLEQLNAQLPAIDCKTDIQVVVRSRQTEAIAQIARDYDVVVVRSQRRRIGSGLSLGTLTRPLLEQLSGSIILVAEPSLYRSDAS